MVTVSRKELVARFAAEDALAVEAPPGVIAPSQTAAVITMERKLETQRWGLKPSWEAHSGHSVLLINARAESLTHKPTFRDLLAQQRCLIPASGFFEWEKLPNGKKRALYFRLPSGGLFAFAGLWMAQPETHQRAFTIITTAANDTVKAAHDRMPAMLPQAAEALWLKPAAHVEELLALLHPYTEQPLRVEDGALRLAPPSASKQTLLPF
jgi:putative SOS response-associated peptidase YedK